MTKRLGVRLAVAATALLCLGVAGYVGQGWWSGVIVDRLCSARLKTLPEGSDFAWSMTLQRWKGAPRWGRVSGFVGCVFSSGRDGDEGSESGIGTTWIPRQTYGVLLRNLTGQNLPNNPDAWEAWFKARPDLVWDYELKRLVEPKPVTCAP